MTCYIMAASRTWPLQAFAERRERLGGNWSVVNVPGDLQFQLDSFPVRYVFFPHWSHKVPGTVVESTECVCFHMTDVPYGRGGSPLQNLILRGHRSTRVSALRMTGEIDAGPVYMKREMSLEGSAREIFERCSWIVLDMIERIVAEEPEPVPQSGESVFFTRRKPEESRLPNAADAGQLYDHIRMLDAPGYPPAFHDFGDWRVTYSGACLRGDGVEARARFDKRAGENSCEN